MPERNIELLEATLQYITDHPEQHDQTTWAQSAIDCGTVACFAGWACALGGYELNVGHNWDAYVVVDGQRRKIPEAAQELLGLNSWEAVNLFSGGNDLIHLQMMVKDLVNGAELRDRKTYWYPDDKG